MRRAMWQCTRLRPGSETPRAAASPNPPTTPRIGVAPGAIRAVPPSVSASAIPALTIADVRGRARTDARGHARVDAPSPPRATVDRLCNSPTRARQPARCSRAAAAVAADAIGATAAIAIDPIKSEARDPKPALTAVSSALDVCAV